MLRTLKPKQGNYYFDTVTLSNFALAARIEILRRRYGKRLRVTVEVLDELTAGVVSGYPELMEIESGIQKGYFTAERALNLPDERNLYRSLLRVLSSGEASCLTCAISRGGMVVTDDRAARECCIEHGVSVTGTIGILKACCLDQTLKTADADLILTTMIEKGYLSPVRRISDIL